MRYYDIKLSGGREFSSLVGGQPDPGALLVEFDVIVQSYAEPYSASVITIWGVSLQDIAQAENFVNQTIQVYGGMSAGLPLATSAAKYAGLLFEGYVYNAFANWIGTEQTLNFIVVAGSPPAGANSANAKPAPPPNLVLNWKQGTTLQTALQNAIKTAFPGYSVSGTINSGLVLPHDEQGFYESLNQLALYVKQASAAIIGGTYTGVEISLSSKTFLLFDSSAAASSTIKQIQFQDLIGQPTWIQSPSIQFKTPMRADIKVGDQIKMPPTVVNNTQQAQSAQVNQRAAFQGTFIVTLVRHIGNSRQPSGDSWVTVFNAVPQSSS